MNVDVGKNGGAASAVKNPYDDFVRRYENPRRAYGSAHGEWVVITKLRKEFRWKGLFAFGPHIAAIGSFLFAGLTDGSDRRAMVFLGMIFLCVAIIWTLFGGFFFMYGALKSWREYKKAVKDFRKTWGLDPLKYPPWEDGNVYAARLGLKQK